MKPILALLLPLLLLTGCATSDSPRLTPQRVERSMDSVVGIFATVKLREHPQSRPALEAARDGLNALVAQERWDVAAFGEALAATGATELTGQDLVLIVQTSVTLIDLVTGGTIDLSESQYAAAVIKGGHKALNRVLTR